MAWSGGTFTRADGTTGWADDAAASIGIQADLHDTNDNDLASGINNCLTKDGTNSPTANLPMAGYKHTNVANASSASDYMAYGQIRNGDPLYMDTTNKRLGINTSTPEASLQVSSASDPVVLGRFSADAAGAVTYVRKSRHATLNSNTIVQNNDAVGGLHFQGANGTGYSTGASITAEVDGTPGAANDMPMRIVIRTAADGTATLTDRFEVKNTGYININNAAGSSTFNIKGYSGVVPLSLKGGAAADSSVTGMTITKVANDNTTANLLANFFINNGATGSGQINANGASQCAFGTFSDERLKENIVDLPSQYESLKALRPVEFDYKDGSGHQLGFIAQEVQAIYPDLVAEASNGFLTVSGMGKNEARLVKGFQELAAALEVALARIAALEAKAP